VLSVQVHARPESKGGCQSHILAAASVVTRNIKHQVGTKVFQEAGLTCRWWVMMGQSCHNCHLQPGGHALACPSAAGMTSMCSSSWNAVAGCLPSWHHQGRQRQVNALGVCGSGQHGLWECAAGWVARVALGILGSAVGWVPVLGKRGSTCQRWVGLGGAGGWGAVHVWG